MFISYWYILLSICYWSIMINKFNKLATQMATLIAQLASPKKCPARGHNSESGTMTWQLSAVQGLVRSTTLHVVQFSWNHHTGSSSYSGWGHTLPRIHCCVGQFTRKKTTQHGESLLSQPGWHLATSRWQWQPQTTTHAPVYDYISSWCLCGSWAQYLLGPLTPQSTAPRQNKRVVGKLALEPFSQLQGLALLYLPTQWHQHRGSQCTFSLHAQTWGWSAWPGALVLGVIMQPKLPPHPDCFHVLSLQGRCCTIYVSAAPTNSGSVEMWYLP